MLGLLIAALVLAELVKDVAFSTDRGDWLPVWSSAFYGMIACLPFLLARMAPKAASFDTQWLPGSRWHWAWFLGMVLLVILSKLLVSVVAVAIAGRIPLKPFFGPVTPAGIFFLGIATIVIGPVAEEIFFRGYVLDQLRKLTHSGIALLIHSLLFGLFHLYGRGVFTSLALFSAVSTFVFGVILGAWRMKFRSLLPLVLAHILFNAALIVPLKVRYDFATGRTDPIRHSISEETTRITGPLRADGSVDYVAFLNGRSSEGVTPENNAAVLFWRAVGPGEILPEHRARYFRMLGVRPPRGKGDYFVDFDQFVADRTKTGAGVDEEPEAGTEDGTSDPLRLATTRPWSRREFPMLAQWLAANEKPLALLGEASKRPHRYDPLCGRERMALMAVPLPTHLLYREAARTLCARAMLRLGEGRTAEAWEDLLACHRLARLIGQGPTTIEALGASAVEETACLGDRALLQHARLDAGEIAEMRNDLNRLLPMPLMADKIDVAERFTYLDIVSDYSRHGISSVIEFYDELMEFDVPESQELKETVNVLRQYGNDTLIDWDLVLRMGNAWYDQLVDTYRKPTGPEQSSALRKAEDDLRRLKKTAADAELLARQIPDNPSKAISERLGQILLTFYASDPTQFIQSERWWIMRLELDKLGFVLALYRDCHGVYPERLADLMPTHVARIPDDLFNDSGLRYRRDGEGYLLYSVGKNGKSDGARGYEDNKNLEGWDDLVIRVPGRAVGRQR